MFTSVKAVLSGSLLEVKYYENPIEYDFKIPNRQRNNGNSTGETN